jgi:UDP-glucose 4-epimerase
VAASDLEAGVPDLSGERVLVTGGAGFIGRSVVAGLVGAGAAVRVLDQLESHFDQAETVLGDLCDPAVREIAVTPDLTGIVHLAAITSVLGSLRQPARVHQVNVEATAGLLELARVRGVRKVLMSSTNAVVGDVGERTIHEDLPLRPLTPYGATKAAAEMLLSGYAGGYGMVTAALRLTNVYGPGMAHKDSLVPRIMRAVRAGTPLQVYGDGTQRRDFVHVDDVVSAVLAAWHHDVTGSVIVGSGRSVSVLDVIAEAGAVTGSPVRVEHVDPKPGEMPAVIVSVDKARRLLGYEPSVDLAEGLKTVWSEFK